MFPSYAKVLFGFVAAILWGLGGCLTTDSFLSPSSGSSSSPNKPDPEKISQARETLSQVHNVNDQVAENFYQQGQSFEENGLIREAIGEYRKALKVKPSFVHEIHTQLGLLYSQSGEHDLALEAFSAALQTNPQSALLYYQRALVWMDKGDTSQATEDLRRALAINPNFAQAHCHLGKILWDSDRTLSMEHLRKYLALAENSQDSQVQEIREWLRPRARQTLPAARASFPRLR